MRAAGRTRRSGDIRGRRTSASAWLWRSTISWPFVSSPRLAGEGHAEELEQPLRFLVGLRRRHDADLQPAETVHLVVFDLGERELLAEPEGVVATPIERLAGNTPEVADARQSKRREAIQEVPHPLAAEGHLGPDRVARPETELGDRALGLGHDRL